MRPLTERLNLSPQWRIRLGWLCAAGSLACLTSTVHSWSDSYPVEVSPAEQKVFSNLADVENPPIMDDRQAGAEVAHSFSVAVTDETTAHRVRRQAGRRFAASEKWDSSQRPHRQRPHFILPVVHRDTDTPALVWLSGKIEGITDTSHP
jgi:hypothetical protein